jgi:hypothetical protein
LQGSTPWHRYSLTLDVPENSTSLAYGAEVHGVGKLWVDSVQLDFIDEEAPKTPAVKPTNRHFPPLQEQPLPATTNLDFEE